jgi:glycosyltransferase involved in cell wall biosynthesis
MASVYYIIPTHAIGGAEKRFIELWAYLQAHPASSHKFCLIISRKLAEKISTDNILQPLILKYNSNVFYFDIDESAGVYSFQKKLYQFVCSVTNTSDILHFIIGFPSLIAGLKHYKTIYTLTENSLKNVNIKGKISYILNILRATQVDILDPILHKKFSTFLFFKKRHIHLTPGSFVDTELFTPVSYAEKENNFVFLGRFYSVKQVLPLLQAIPEILKKAGKYLAEKKYKFIFIGYGPQETEMKNIIAEDRFKGLQVEIINTNNPQQVLSRSKIFFSLQLNNNYPSKSLLEAMAAGNIPVVTDVGTTRVLAHPDFSYYVPEKFTSTDLAEKIIAILKMSDAEQQVKAIAAREFVIKNFAISTSANYYKSLYFKFDR